MATAAARPQGHVLGAVSGRPPSKHASHARSRQQQAAASPHGHPRASPSHRCKRRLFEPRAHVSQPPRSQLQVLHTLARAAALTTLAGAGVPGRRASEPSSPAVTLLLPLPAKLSSSDPIHSAPFLIRAWRARLTTWFLSLGAGLFSARREPGRKDAGRAGMESGGVGLRSGDRRERAQPSTSEEKPRFCEGRVLSALTVIAVRPPTRPPAHGLSVSPWN
ncbi:hypothetical protein BS78_02G215800 [Paspalum vaginatum]|nr:hypothetical protein BS78_02G215800 [Paspalum vaginatum]